MSGEKWPLNSWKITESLGISRIPFSGEKNSTKRRKIDKSYFCMNLV